MTAGEGLKAEEQLWQCSRWFFLAGIGRRAGIN